LLLDHSFVAEVVEVLAMSAQGRDFHFPQYDAEGFVHNPESGFSLFLQERCKRIFFIRHAQGYHNIPEDENELLKENSGTKYWDARLTPHGEAQCTSLKANIRGDTVWGFEKPLNLDLVVVSPLTRTLQTAVLSLGDPTSPGAPPFIATELCRERVADYMCDGRRNLSELKAEFPGVDFSLITDEEDVGFVTQKEDDTLAQARGVKFLQWLCCRPEIHIAVVTHSVFLKNLLLQFGTKLSPSDREAIQRFPANAEMRSIMLCAHRAFQRADAEDGNEDSNRKCQRQKALWNGS
jgi:broad specificity phosphatase PhoE